MRRNVLLLLVLSLLAAGLVALVLVPRSLAFGPSSIWLDGKTNTVLEFKPSGEVDVQVWHCNNWPHGGVDTKTYKLETTRGSFVFPEQQVEQPYDAGSLLASLSGPAEQAFTVAEPGPIPGGTYSYMEFSPIGLCGLQP